ncbi:hypothetical protein AB1Y20_009388 [Prymnesium parvum]|uniref:Dipeptidyl peptidase 1 n=1 Tax=Prymnesium parvum TaxID=97485 RepID=A0AB34K205_PRYPA
MFWLLSPVAAHLELLSHAVLADLPVHCLHHDIAGRWELHIGAPSAEAQRCGAHTPGQTADPMAKAEGVVRPRRLYRVSLVSPNLAVGEDGASGFWTMVYDEGFEIRIGGTSYFAFSAFHKSSEPANNAPLAPADTKGYASECNRTAAGWYRANSSAPVWGCYFALQRARQSSADAVEQLAAFEKRKDEGAVTMQRPSVSGAGSSATSGQPLQPSTYDASPLKDDGRPRQNESKSFIARSKIDSSPEEMRFASLPREWDWRNVSGVSYLPPVRAQGSCGSCYAISTIAMLESRIAIASGGRERVHLSVQDVLSCSPYSQGCEGGFPYLVGKYLHDFGVPSEECFPYASPNEVPCSQHCATPARRWRAVDYRYVGGWYGGCKEVEMMREIYSRGPIVVGFEAHRQLYGYTGGIVSAAAEFAGSIRRRAPLAEEMGPVVAPPDGSMPPGANVDFMEGSGGRANEFGVSSLNGSYTGNASNEIGGEDEEYADNSGTEARVDGSTTSVERWWERTNHAVLVVGWGLEQPSGRKYWVAMNTWGAEWGEKGFFRIARGTDDSAFESMAVAADVGFPKRPFRRFSQKGMSNSAEQVRSLQPEGLMDKGGADRTQSHESTTTTMHAPQERGILWGGLQAVLKYIVQR